jgi:hypothetical protein
MVLAGAIDRGRTNRLTYGPPSSGERTGRLIRGSIKQTGEALHALEETPWWLLKRWR